MKFLKLEMHNFKPYYDSPNEDQTCILYNENKPKRNICVNVGPTGNGKTSISEAIKWCIFGEIHHRDWDEWINDLSMEIAKAKNDDYCKVTVELLIECEGEKYNIIRSGRYDFKENEKVGQPELTIIRNGEPLKKNESEEFIKKHFLPLDLMEYYIFDADDILKLFEKDRRKTIRDHINKIVGVEILDDISSSLKAIESEYIGEKEEIFIESDQELGTKLREIATQISIKNEAISTINSEISKMKKRQGELFSNVPSNQVKTFTDLCEKRVELKKEIEDLNEKFRYYMFNEHSLLSNLDLIVLSDSLNDAIDKLSKREVNKIDFDTSIDIVKSVIINDYQGIIFKNGSEASLIKDGIDIDNNFLDNVTNLNLSTVSSGIGTDTLAEFKKYQEVSKNLSEKFLDYKDYFRSLQDELMLVQNKIEMMGETEEKKELKEKYEEYVNLDTKIKEKREEISEISEILSKLKNEKDDLNKKIELNDENKEEKELFEQKIKFVGELHEIINNSKKEFLKELLNVVNEEASNFLRNVTKEKLRYYSIEINSDYDFKVKTKQGNTLKDSQINRGNLQIAMMSFFFGLSKHFPKKLPYIIDDPLIRLDIGHEKRLIQQLSKTNEQLILHMIPFREYSTESYTWLQPFLNHQNWIDRKKHRTIEIEYSYIESKDPDKIIKLNIEEM